MMKVCHGASRRRSGAVRIIHGGDEFAARYIEVADCDDEIFARRDEVFRGCVAAWHANVAGRLTLDLHEHDLAGLVAACAEDSRIVADSRGIGVHCALPPSAPARVDARRVTQILSNLLDNAVKYNRSGGAHRAHCRGSCVAPERREYWPGLAPEQTRHLFQRFYRTDHTAEVPAPASA